MSNGQTHGQTRRKDKRQCYSREEKNVLILKIKQHGAKQICICMQIIIINAVADRIDLHLK